MTEQFLVEIFVKTFLSVIEIIILLAVIIKVLRLEALLTPRSVAAYSRLASLLGPNQTAQPYDPRLPYAGGENEDDEDDETLYISLGVCGVEGDTKLSPRLG